jgi:hypothetical protein
MSADEHSENLRRLVNTSGFPLQLRVAEEIRGMDHGAWSVVAEEHPWHDADTRDEGFIDLVVSQSSNHDLHRMVIECKRTRDADWVFLLPDRSNDGQGSHVRCMWISTYPQNLREGTDLRSGYHDFYIAPESYISPFCIVRGTGEGQRPMLENLCARLLTSLESFAREELNLFLSRNRTERRYYVPMIVTNARLTVCRFNLGSVSLDAGEVPGGVFEEVSYIRFIKSLTTRISEDPRINTIAAANRDRHRTVLVVQSAHLTEFLNAWYLNLNSRNPLPNW